MKARALLFLAMFLATLAGAVHAQVVTPHPAPVTPPAPPRSPPLRADWDDGAGVSYAIYPTQSIPLRFNHAQHMNMAGLQCVRCHTTAPDSTRVDDRLIPGEQTCQPCHAIDRAQPARESHPTTRCEGCHEGFNPQQPMRVARVTVPTPNLRFSHRAHLTRGATCESCHGAMRSVDLATRLELPRMSSCVGCHRPGGAVDRCSTCHLTQPDGTLQIRFAEGVMNPPRWMRGMHHDADFWFTHRISAAQDGSRCATCHHEDECVACHDGRTRDRRTHPNDYVTLHVPDARMSSDRCGSCHRASTFCVACHERSGVSMNSAPAARALGRFHPPASVWVSGPITSRHHGAEARRALTSCTSCHAEQDCVTCHATRRLGGGGFSPHPPGFIARCGALLRASDRPCRQCHEDLSAITARCR